MLHSVYQQIWKTQQCYRTGAGQFSFQSQRRAMPKNAETTTQLPSFHTLSNAKNSPSQASTVSEPWTSRCSRWILKRQRKQRSNCEHQQDHQKKQESSRKYLFLLYWLCQSLCVDHNILWKILKETRIPDNLTCLLGNLYAGQEAMVRIRHGTTD